MITVVDKISEDFLPHKQMSEHAKIRNTDNKEDICGEPRRKNHGGAKVDYK